MTDVTTGAEALALDRASFEHLLVHASLCSIDQIRAAIERADHEAAVIRALARVQLERELTPELVADVVVDVERADVFLALARRGSAGALLDLHRNGRIADDPVGIEQTLYIAFAQWQQSAPER